MAIYFDKGCFSQLVSHIPTTEQESDLLHYFVNLLRAEVHICFGFPKEDLQEIFEQNKSNTTARLVLNTMVVNPQKNNITIEENKPLLPNLDIDQTKPHYLFFVDKTDAECAELQANYGYLFFNFSLFLAEGYQLFSSHIFNVTKQTNAKNKLTKWADLAPLTLPCNALVIIDNYILENEEDIKINLIPLLEILLPKELKTNNFDLTVITQNAKSKDYKPRKELIETTIKRPYILNISVVVSTLAGDNHDRNIFTNYQWFNSGNTFAYFNPKGDVKKITTLFYHPIWHLQKELKGTNLDKTVFWSVCALLEEANAINNKAINTTLTTFWGNKQNRLLQNPTTPQP